jgi:hypothetical protein
MARASCIQRPGLTPIGSGFVLPDKYFRSKINRNREFLRKKKINNVTHKFSNAKQSCYSAQLQFPIASSRNKNLKAVTNLFKSSIVQRGRTAALHTPSGFRRPEPNAVQDSTNAVGLRSVPSPRAPAIEGISSWGPTCIDTAHLGPGAPSCSSAPAASPA